MYEKFQNHKLEKLKFTEIYKLVEPILNLEKGVWLEDLYFIGKTLKEYAGLPDDHAIKAFIEHAAQLSDYAKGGFKIDESLPSIVISPFRVSVIESISGNNGAYAVGPYIAYSKSALSDGELKAEKERLGKNLLVFPAHSIRGVKTVYDIDAFCKEIKKYAKNFDSVRICLYWKDILLGTAEIYKKYGFEIVTAGHFHDPMFMPRLKSIIETSTMTMSNKLGTYIGYCIYLNKPHFLVKSELDTEMILDEGKEFAEHEYEISKKVQEKLKNKDIDLLKEVFSKYEEVITEEQRDIVNKYWGLTEIKSPKQLRKLLLELEGEYRLKFGCIYEFQELQSVIYRLENEIKAFRENIELKEEEINHLAKNIELKDDKIKLMANSNSWKLTKPLRKVGIGLRKLKNSK